MLKANRFSIIESEVKLLIMIPDSPRVEDTSNVSTQLINGGWSSTSIHNTSSLPYLRLNHVKAAMTDRNTKRRAELQNKMDSVSQIFEKKVKDSEAEIVTSSSMVGADGKKR